MMPPAAAISRAATHLKVLSAGAVKYVVTDVAAKFTRDTGDDIELTFATIGGVQKRLEHGETADIIMGTASVIAQMERAGVLVPGSRAELGRTLTGICVHAAAPMPDIATPESFKQTMLKARSVAYTNPQAGGTSGIFLAGLLERLGIAAAVGRDCPDHC
jgi:molybdate transport system substrate-binding protein